MLTKVSLLKRDHNILHDLFTAIINCDENKDYFRSKDATDTLVHMICAVGDDE